MLDAALAWGGDLGIGPTGDLLLADGTGLGQQRVMRRLLTNPGDYIWQLGYGGGLGQFVGQANASRMVGGVVYAQLRQEASVARMPLPLVTPQTLDGDVTLSIQYSDAASHTTQTLSFSMSS